MVRPPRIEHGVERGLVIEIAVALVDREPRRGHGDQNRAGAALNYLMAFAGCNHDHLVTEAGRGTQLGLDVSANTSAGGRVESANVGDTHSRLETGRTGELQVKVCSWDWQFGIG